MTKLIRNVLKPPPDKSGIFYRGLIFGAAAYIGIINLHKAWEEGDSWEMILWGMVSSLSVLVIGSTFMDIENADNSKTPR